MYIYRRWLIFAERVVVRLGSPTRTTLSLSRHGSCANIIPPSSFTRLPFFDCGDLFEKANRHKRGAGAAAAGGLVGEEKGANKLTKRAKSFRWTRDARELGQKFVPGGRPLLSLSLSFYVLREIEKEVAKRVGGGGEVECGDIYRSGSEQRPWSSSVDDPP